MNHEAQFLRAQTRLRRAKPHLCGLLPARLFTRKRGATALKAEVITTEPSNEERTQAYRVKLHNMEQSA